MRFLLALLLVFQTVLPAFAGTGKVVQTDNIDGVKVSKNFISNGLASIDTKGWATYKDTAGTRPVDGTGGTPTLVTFTRTTTSPLSDAASFLFTVAGTSSAQGEGASFDFTIDDSQKAKVLKIEADYIVNSGTFVAGSNTTDSDVIAYIYDVTNATLIEPSSFKFLSNSSTISDKFSATFQSSSNSTSYRLIFHVASTSTAAYSLKLDNISVSPSNYVYGTPITDWQSYTPTFNSLGTPTSVDVKWRRAGDSVEIIGTFVNGTVGAGTATVSLPPGLVGKMSNYMVVGNYGHSGTATGNEVVYHIAGGYLVFGMANWQVFASGTQMATSGNTAFTAKVPILGWSSSVQMSDGYDGRVVAAMFFATKGSSTTVDKMTISSVDFDLTNSRSGNDWIVPSAGVYKVTMIFQSNVGSSSVSDRKAYIYVDGVQKHSLTTTGSYVSNTTLTANINLKAGQAISFYAQTATIAGVGDAIISIEKLSGSPTISASETVAALYTGAPPTGTLGAAYNITTFGTKVKDSHGAYSGGVYTVPVSGLYDIRAVVGINASSSVTSDISRLAVGINGTTATYQGSGYKASGSNSGYPSVSVTSVPLNAGDTVRILAKSDMGGLSYNSNASENYFSITKVK